LAAKEGDEEDQKDLTGEEDFVGVVKYLIEEGKGSISDTDNVR
jgi:hypothetical protein